MATATGQAPMVQVLEVRVPAFAAADATADVAIGKAQVTGTVTGVEFVPDADLNGADTNSATLAVVNKGTDGNGNTEIASRAFTAGVNAPDFDATAITLSGTAANKDVTAGQELAFRRTKVGTGLATPAGLLRVTISRA